MSDDTILDADTNTVRNAGGSRYYEYVLSNVDLSNKLTRYRLHMCHIWWTYHPDVRVLPDASQNVRRAPGDRTR